MAVMVMIWMATAVPWFSPWKASSTAGIPKLAELKTMTERVAMADVPGWKFNCRVIPNMTPKERAASRALKRMACRISSLPGLKMRRL